jgi:hypothetical protein
VADNEWKIAKPAGTCCQCSGALTVVGATYFSALLQSPEGLQRRDYCADCFQKNRPADVYYFWKTTHRDEEDKSKRRQPVVDVDFVLDFFKRLEGEPGAGQPEIPQRLAFRYILALMLTRKKILLLDGKKKDASGRDVLVYKEKRGDGVHDVVEPTLSADEISAVSSELGALLGLKAPDAPAPKAPQDTQASSTAG